MPDLTQSHMVIDVAKNDSNHFSSATGFYTRGEMSNNSSAAHWCKAVIEQVVPNAGLNVAVPPPTPPSFGKNGTKAAAPAATTPLNADGINPQYLQLYQQLYSKPVVATDRTYASVAAQPNPAASLSRPISAPWGATYTHTTGTVAPSSSSMPVPAPVHPTLANALKNKARFTAPPMTVGAPQALSTARAPMPVPTPSHQPTGQPESLKSFVKRAFSSCTSGAHREFITKSLKEKIATATSNGQLHSHNWDEEPIPAFNPFAVSAPSAPVFKAPAAHPTAGRTVIQNISGPVTGLSDYISFNNSSSLESSRAGAGVKRKSRFDDGSNSSSSSNGNNPLSSAVFSGVEKLNTHQEFKMREQRANRFQQQEQEQAAAFNPYMANDTHQNKKRKKTINANAGKIAALMAMNNNSDFGADFDLDSLKIVGTCQKLEKDYLRLTSAPHPSVVRPESVLRKAVQLIKKKWAAEEVDYVYMCSQLKSLRQDLTVQHIQNEFTVHVYETHARVALESDDMNEYNQCQTQLKHLYAAGLKGAEMEFTAYRILYYVYLLGNKKYTGGSKDLAHLISSLRPEAFKDEAVSHALQVRQALQLDNYHRFFKLYRDTPNMGAYILDLMLDNWRAQALQKMNRGYKPEVTASFVVSTLAFDDEAVGLEFMRKLGCVLVVDKATGVLMWNTKDATVDPTALLTQAKLLL